MQEGADGRGAGRAFLRHPSVRALLEAVGTTDPDEAMRVRARALVDRASRLGWAGPPFDLELLASLTGYRVHYTDALTDGQDGYIVAGTRQILINTRISRTRQRFTIAHEIAHTLLPDFGHAARHHGGYEFDAQSPVELLCQVGAAEILMPLAAFEAASGKQPVSLGGIAHLSDLFGASFEAVARRWVSLAPPGTSLLIAQPDSTVPEVLDVTTSVQSGTGRPLHFPYLRSVPPRSIAYDVWRRAKEPGPRPCMGEAVEDWTWPSRIGIRRVEVIALPRYGENATSVLCLLHELPPP